MLLGAMKSQLSLGEFRFGGKESESFRYFKQQTMNTFYEGAKKFYKDGIEKGVFEPCPCGANIRHGYKTCQWCHGSGYRDVEKKD
jgi:hypothetical protein